MSDNQLQVIAKQNGLEGAEAQNIVAQFDEFAQIAAEWDKKAQAIVVTNASQVDVMKAAREARLFLKGKRGKIKDTHKALKETALAECKALDGIHRHLRGLIEPIEAHLAKQENFIEIMAEKAAQKERERIAAEVEAARLADIEAAKELAEKARLKAEKEKKELLEREAAAKKIEDEAKAEREAALAKAEEERQKEAVERRRIQDEADAKQKAIEEKAEADKRAAEQKRVELEAELEAKKAKLADMVECPKCHHKFELFEVVTEPEE